ncbi:uncharacterized protein B0I36DRAFT_388315 [Microdochium trichocladiopsis]|uniref:Uncharacterized protein n=1 Tax=Microdochium trichocladiopsis TaxID=1682393 RepID=A0A9P8XVY8_9PEZI|nr:uncharacterized protein B0I36DRAFT_388315 [Microdochium trichocladiopsis]KAH7018019.1 hypothetical protein B0I36DRAFT_388315 [Microdochium trichocladiopsis]
MYTYELARTFPPRPQDVVYHVGWMGLTFSLYWSAMSTDPAIATLMIRNVAACSFFSLGLSSAVQLAMLIMERLGPWTRPPLRMTRCFRGLVWTLVLSRPMSWAVYIVTYEALWRITATLADFAVMTVLTIAFLGLSFPSLGALSQLASEQKPLMDTIDELRRYQIDRIIDLPQIIVIGDQSSGKSSVLAAISRIPFPAKGTVCTRFAIELVLRTSSRSTLGAHIHRTDGSAVELRAVADTNFDNGLLAQIIGDAGQRMRAPTGFSEDVLRVEICRPDVPHLTLIDLPGFYHSENEEQSAEGRELVERLADKYMARDTSIILAIVAASNDMILQSVLSKVRRHDKGGRRTLGIITKPDLLLPGSRGELIVRLARNTHPSHALELGWHVLRNRDEDEKDDSDDIRDAKEQELCDKAPWNSLRSADRGVARLRTKLSNILLRHIQKSLPDLDDNIQRKISEYDVRIRQLGPPRDKPTEMRAFLDRVASQYQNICSRALSGNYSHEFFGGLYPDDEEDGRIRKIRALVRDLNRAYTYILASRGSRRRVVFPDDHGKLGGDAESDGDGGTNDSDSDSDRSSGDGDTDAAEEAQAFIGGWSVHASGEILRLTQAYKFDEPEKVPVAKMARELELLASRNQGTELPGSSNDSLALNLFRDQITPWNEIASFHVRHVTSFARAFVEKLLTHIIDEQDGAPYLAIAQHLVDPFFETTAANLHDKVAELLFHYQEGHPQPFDPEFEALYIDARRRSTVDAAVDMLKEKPWLLSEEGRALLADRLRQAQDKVQPAPAALDIIAKCQTYYQISIYSFINNVIVLALENCLIRKLPSIITTEMVSRMEDEELRLLAAESATTQLDRAELQRNNEALKKAAKALRPYRTRGAHPALPMFVNDAVSELPSPDKKGGTKTDSYISSTFGLSGSKKDPTNKAQTPILPQGSHVNPTTDTQTSHESVSLGQKPLLQNGNDPIDFILRYIFGVILVEYRGSESLFWNSYYPRRAGVVQRAVKVHIWAAWIFVGQGIVDL